MTRVDIFYSKHFVGITIQSLQPPQSEQWTDIEGHTAFNLPPVHYYHISSLKDSIYFHPCHQRQFLFTIIRRQYCIGFYASKAPVP